MIWANISSIPLHFKHNEKKSTRKVQSKKNQKTKQNCKYLHETSGNPTNIVTFKSRYIVLSKPDQNIKRLLVVTISSDIRIDLDKYKFNVTTFDLKCFPHFIQGISALG